MKRVQFLKMFGEQQASYTLRFVNVVRFLSSSTALRKAPNVLDAFVILQSTSKSNFSEASIVDPRYVKSRTYFNATMFSMYGTAIFGTYLPTCSHHLSFREAQ